VRPKELRFQASLVAFSAQALRNSSSSSAHIQLKVS